MTDNVVPVESRDDLAVRLDATLARVGEASATPGAQAALVRHGALEWAGSYGLAHVETRTPVHERTVFCLASVGKTLLAALTLHLVERGVLGLDATLTTLGGGDIPGASTVTPRMLLSHTAGYPDLYETTHVRSLMPPDPASSDRSSYDPNREFTWTMLVPGILEPVEPGEHWAYSNTGYIVLVEVLARVLGGAQGLEHAWTSFVHAVDGDRDAMIARELTMNRSAVEVSQLAHGYEQRDDGAFVDAYAAHAPIGVPTDLFGLPFGDGLFAGAATGVAMFFDALFVRRRLLAPETVRLMTTTTTQAAAAAAPHPDLNTYGMGTFRMDSPTGSWQGHRGLYGGFATIGTSQPASGTSLVVLANSVAEPVPVLSIWRELVASI
jgi:D-alanyl-D-alanine carboxypeptidase